MKKWNNKLYIFTIVGTIIALAIMVTHNYVSFYNNVNSSMSEIGTSNLAYVTERLEGYLSTGMEVVQTTAVSVEYMLENGGSAQEIEEFLVYESKRYTEEIDQNFSGIYGVFNEEYIDGIGWVPGDDYNPYERDWYIAAVEANGEPVLVSPYVDAQTGTVMISISKLLNDNKSVMSLDIVMDEIQNITEKISLNGMGYGFVVNESGLVVAHADSGKKGMDFSQNQSMQTVLEKIYANDSVYFEAEMDGEKCTIYSDSVMDDWYVVMIVSNSRLYADARVILFRDILISILISALIIFFYLYTLIRMKRSMEAERISNEKIERMNENVIKALARTIDAKDRYTNGHSLRVAEYSREIARRMNKSPKEQEVIYYAGLLHDVGKIRVPEDVINKPSKLTDEEFEQIKIHPVTGYHILKDIYEDKTMATAAKFHHERYDGKGYPNGLKGENIPEIARIIGVADTYDAMASNRSYRKSLSQEAIREEIERCKGTQFDPQVADIMLEMIREDHEYKMRETDSLNKTILVVDDELINIKMIRFIMRDEPRYTILSATSGDETMEVLEQNNVDLVLLDVKLPDMDGFEILACIREKYHMPVAFMTGDKNIETIQKASQAGVEDYITKPLLPLALKEIVHSILNY